MCIYVQDKKFLWSNLWLGGLSTDDDTNTDNDANTDNDTNDDTRRPIHDCIGSSAISKWANNISKSGLQDTNSAIINVIILWYMYVHSKF